MAQDSRAASPSQRKIFVASARTCRARTDLADRVDHSLHYRSVRCLIPGNYSSLCTGNSPLKGSGGGWCSLARPPSFHTCCAHVHAFFLIMFLNFFMIFPFGPPFCPPSPVPEPPRPPDPPLERCSWDPLDSHGSLALGCWPA